MTTKVGVLVFSLITSTVGNAMIGVSVASAVDVVTTVTSIVGVEVISRVGVDRSGVSVMSAVGAISTVDVMTTSGVIDTVSSTRGVLVDVAQILLYLSTRVASLSSSLT